ncbi:hypothetical protein SESBI_17144, partial [Sesbania bispinosa]
MARAMQRHQCVVLIMMGIFVLVTWIFLRMHLSSPSLISSNSNPTIHMDIEANLVRFRTGNGIPSRIVKDNRGWLLDPLSLASASALSGGAVTCASIHVGEIRPGRLRGNHRHHDCNETLVIWGAATKFR